MSSPSPPVRLLPPARKSLPIPPSRVSLSLPLTRLSLPPPPLRLSFPAPPSKVSLPSKPLMVSLPSKPAMLSLPAVPVRLSLPGVPVVRLSPPAIVASVRLAARIAVPERLLMVSIKPAPATVGDAPKKSKTTKSSAVLAIPSLLISTTRLVPRRPSPAVPADSDRERFVLVPAPRPTLILSMPSVS